MKKLRFAAGSAFALALVLSAVGAEAACTVSKSPSFATSLDTMTADQVALTGGCIDGVAIGQNTPAAGNFSALTVNGVPLAGTGTVTSVALTPPGGTVFSIGGSPITGTGTLALSAAGTSGGIPYFSSASAIGTSAALTANNPVIGGGAGVAPSVGSRSGNTTTFATTTGSLTSGHIAAFDVSGNIVDGGNPAGSGTVTSVGLSVPATSIFGITGSPITGAGSLGLTTTGTSGGIPYFSSGTQVASSAALTANAPVIGGGAGVAPSVGTRSGNTTAFATVSGALTNTHAAVFDASGNIIDGGVTPGGSGSWNLSDTVTPLTAVTNLTVDHTAFTVGGTAGAATLGPLCPAAATTLGDASGAISVGKIARISATLTAPRSFSMPPIASYPVGCQFTIVDANRTVSGTNTATITRNADNATLNTGTTYPAITTAGFFTTWESDGTNWSLVGNGTVATLQAGQIYYGNASNLTVAGIPTGDVIPNSSNAWTIQSGVVTNAKAATMAAHSYKGNNTGSTGAPLDLTATQFTAELNVMGGDAGSGGVKGLVPAQVTGDAAKFLKGDGTWATASGGTGCVPSGSAGQILTDSGAGACTSNATLTDLSGVVTATQAFALSGSISPTALVADVNDYAPSGNSTAVRLRMDAGGADRNVTGLANGASGITKIIYNAGATNNLTVVDESASSSAANRFHLGSNNITIAPGKARAFLYDATLSRWTNIDAALGNTGVTAGSYTNMNATVSTDGRVTAASNGNPQFMAITSTVSTNATRFTALAGSFSTGEPAMLFPRTTTVKSMTPSLSADPASGQSYAFTVRKNAVDTALTCTVTGNGSTGTTCTAATDISFLTTDKFSLKAVGSASAGAGITASIIFEIQ